MLINDCYSDKLKVKIRQVLMHLKEHIKIQISIRKYSDIMQ
jgi:hypothetical protein